MGKRQQMLTIFSARCMDEYHSGMRSLRCGTNQRTSEMDFTIGESNIFTFFDLHALREPRRPSVAGPAKRGYSTARIALELDPRLDGIRYCCFSTREEMVRLVR